MGTSTDELVNQLPKGIRLVYTEEGQKPEEWDYQLTIHTYYDWRETDTWRWTAGYEFYESTLDDGSNEDMRGYGDTIEEALSTLLDKVIKMVSSAEVTLTRLG